MTTDISQNPTPEERELEKKKAELASLEADLIQRELDLATLRAELTEFEVRYFRTVGVLYAELDDIEAQIAEAQARYRPTDHNAQENAAHARAQARESAQTASPIAGTRSKPTEELKTLYRRVAKRIHPDLASSDVDRTRRQQMMAQLNIAYENGDEAKLRSILADWHSSPDTVEGEGTGADLVRVIRKIAQIQNRLNVIDSEIEELNGSDLNLLRTEIIELEKQGRDGLKDMASQVQEQIADARRRLSAATTVEAST
jgi:hypothetical protein